MTKMQWLVGIRTAVLYHDQRTLFRHIAETETRIASYFLEHSDPLSRRNNHVQEALHYVIPAYQLGALTGQIRTYILCRRLGRLAAYLQQGKDHKRQLSLKLGARLLQLYHPFLQFSAIQLPDARYDGCSYFLV